MHNVQIPFKLFAALISFHLGNIPENSAYICSELQRKIAALAKRGSYTQLLTAKTKEEKAKAFEEYIASRNDYYDSF